MKSSSPAVTIGIDGPLDADSLDGLADALGVPEASRRSFKEDVQRAAREFRAERAAPKVDVIRREIASLAKAVAKVINKPTPKKMESMWWRLDHLSPEATNYLLRHRPPHDRSNPPWESNELTRKDLEDLYARCCVRARVKDKSGNLLPKLDIKYGPVKEPGAPHDHSKGALIAQLGRAFHAAKGAYPKRRDIVLMNDYVLGQLGEPVKQDRDWDDTHMAREYLSLLRDSHRD